MKPSRDRGHTSRPKGRGRHAVALALMCAVLSATTPSWAAELDGVSFPDSTTLDGKPLILNGLGQRIAYIFVKVYVAGLYLPEKTTDAKQAIANDVAKEIVMKFQRAVSGDEMRKSMSESLAEAAADPALADRVRTFEKCFDQPLDAGDVVALDYRPGQGTAVVVDGKARATIAGADFMRALLSIWLGPNPPNQSLKDGLLGGA